MKHVVALVILALAIPGCTVPEKAPCVPGREACGATASSFPASEALGPVDHRGGFTDNFTFAAYVGEAFVARKGSHTKITLDVDEPHVGKDGFTVHVDLKAPSGLVATLLVDGQETETGTNFTVTGVHGHAVLDYVLKGSPAVVAGEGRLALSFCDLCLPEG